MLLLPTVAHAGLRLKRVMFMSPSAFGVDDYLPVADMDHDGLQEMAYVTGHLDSITNPWRWEYGRFLPFNRWQLLHSDTLVWLPPSGLQPGSFVPCAMGDADRDGLNEILGSVWAYFYDSVTGWLGDSEFICTMEQPTPTGVPDTITWRHFVSPRGPIPQLVGSLDGDSLADILAWALSDSLRGHYMLENRGDNAYVRTWTPSIRIADGRSVAYCDCDGDGRIEFMTGRSRRALFWEACGDDEYACVFEDTIKLPVAIQDCCFSGRDVNHNGKPEFFQAVSAGLIYLFMWESDADNHFVRTCVDSVQRWQPGPSMCGDLDGDGVDEVVWNTVDYLRIYKAAPGQPLCRVGSWLVDHDPAHENPVHINIADVNYNGYGDILVACKRKLSVLEIEAVSLLAPNSRVTYKAGDTCRISWQTFSPPRCDSVSLFLRTDTTYELDTIARGLAPGDTPYLWIVPDIEADSVRIM
ncbi:VCBS repeat-containing protein, partial [candidate division WOR-3 bacterium]|nr:VCBS repeat-containing protein [candidate division WOR-3 bacterium]